MPKSLLDRQEYDGLPHGGDVGTWNYTRSSVLQAKTKLLELDTLLNRQDATAPWKRLALGLYTSGEGGSGSVSTAPTVSMDMGSVLAKPHSSSTPF